MARPEERVRRLVRERARALGVELDESVVEELSQDVEEHWCDQGGGGAPPDSAAIDEVLAQVPWRELRRRPANLSRRLWVLLPMALREPARQLWSWTSAGSIEQLRGRFLATAAVVILGAGLGAAMAVTRIVESRRSEASPFGEPARMLWIWNLNPAATDSGFSVPELAALEGTAGAHQAVVTGFSSKPLVWSGSGLPQFVDAAHVRPGFFEVFGESASEGRAVRPGDEIGPPGVAIVVVSHTFWQIRLGGSPAVGRQLVLDGRPALIVGVMPPNFRYPAWAEMWVGGSIAPLDDTWRVVARVEEGVDPGVLAKALSPNGSRGVRAVPLSDRLEAPERPFWNALVAMARAVLWISCANLGGIVLAFAALERKALAIRVALGASPAQIARRLIARGFLWGVTAWSVGLVVSAAGVEALSRASGTAPPSLQDLLRLGSPALVVALGTTLASCLALQGASQGSVGPVLRGEDLKLPRWVRWSWPTSITVVAGSSTLLVLAALLLTGSLWRRSTIESRLSLAHVVSFWLYPPAEFSDAAARRAFAEAIADRVDRIDHVEAVSPTDNLPWDRERRSAELSVGDGEARLRVERIVVAPHFFSALRMDVLHGRNFIEGERGRRSALVSKALAAEAWPGREAVGQKLLLDDVGEDWRTVVGVVEDLPSIGLPSASSAAVYLPFDDYEGREFAFLARTSRPADGLSPEIARAVWDLAPDLPMRGLRTANEVQDELLEGHRTLVRVATTLAALAILASWFGLLVVADAWTREQRRELAVRQAMGASRHDIARQVGWRNARAVFLGVAVGIVLGVIGTRFIEAAIGGAHLLDPGVLFGSLALIVFGSGLACLVSARRSARIDPVDSLRS